MKQNNYIGPWSTTNIKSNSNMTISFTINITTLYNDWRNLIHLTNNNVNVDFVQKTNIARIPGVWIIPNTSFLAFECDTPPNANWFNSTTAIPLNTPTNVQFVFSGKNISIYFNKVLSGSITMNSPLSVATPNAYFYIGDPWYKHDGGVQIKDFIIKNSP